MEYEKSEVSQLEARQRMLDEIQQMPDCDKCLIKDPTYIEMTKAIRQQAFVRLKEDLEHHQAKYVALHDEIEKLLRDYNDEYEQTQRDTFVSQDSQPYSPKYSQH